MLKSPALTISRCMIIAISVYMFSHRTDVSCQTVYLDSNGLQTISTCTSGVRLGLDYVVVRGVVDTTTGSLSDTLDFQIQSSPTSNFTDFCSASLSSCITPNPQVCYCAVQNGTRYEIVSNTSASFSRSNVKMRIRWKNAVINNITSSAIQFPTTYNVSAGYATVTLNEIPMICPATVAHGSAIKVTCQNTPSPCNISILLNNTVVGKGDHNVTYTVATNLTANSNYLMNIYFSLCGDVLETPVKDFDPCVLTIEEVTTTAPTSTYVVSNGTTTMSTGSTVSVPKVTVPTTNSTTAPLVTKLPHCSLDCEDWAIALSVIFYAAILVIICTGIAILVLSLKKDKKTVILYLSIGLLIFSEVLDIILIIVFAQAGPCKCDLELALWKIMLIIFCIVNGLLIIAAVAELIWTSVSGTGSNKVEKEEAETDSTSPNANTASTTNTNKTNKRTAKYDEKKRGQHTNSVSNGKEDKEKTDDINEMSESKNTLTSSSKTTDEQKIDETNTQASDSVPVTKLKKKKPKKKGNREHKKESSSTNQTVSETQAENIKNLYS